MLVQADTNEERAAERVRSWPALALLAPVALGLVGALTTLGLVLATRASLREEWGATLPLVLAALAFAALACVAVLARRVRAWRSGEWRPADLAPLRMAFVCAVLGWISYLLFSQPYWPLRVALTMALALGAFAFSWLLAPLGLARLPRRAARALDFALFQLCLALVLAELALGLYGRWSGSRLFDLGRAAAAKELVRWRPEPGRLRLGFPNNSRGDYDDEPSLSPRDHPFVVCIGDSFSTGIVPHFAHFTRVAELHRPALEVYNMGAPSVGPREYLHLLRTEALALVPDLVVIDVFAGNDIAQEAHRERRRNLLRRWFARDELALVLLGRRALRLSDERRRGGGEVGAGPGARETASSTRLTRKQLEARLPWLEDPLAEQPTFGAERFEELELERALDICSAEADYAPFFRALDELADAAGDVPLAVMLIPDELQVEDALWARVRALAGDVTLERDRPQRELAAWCEVRGVPLLDLLPHLRAVPPLRDGARHVYHLQDTHFNARGNRAAGVALASFVEGLLAR